MGHHLVDQYDVDFACVCGATVSNVFIISHNINNKNPYKWINTMKGEVDMFGAKQIETQS